LKFFILISDWTFESAQNSLQLFYNITTNEAPLLTSSTDDQGRLQWQKVSVGDVVLFGKFVEEAEIDGKVRYVSFLPTEGGVAVQIPYFWDFARLDPDYSVLLGDSQQDENGEPLIDGLSWLFIVIVCASGVAGLSVLGAIVYMFNKRKQRAFLRHIYGGIQMK